MRIPDHAYNRLTVLKKLRAAEPVSRTDLARLSGLTGGSITAIIGDLVERRLVLEEKVPSPNRGRPKVNLRINPEGAYVAGATQSWDGHLHVEIVNLKGEGVFAYSRPLDATTRLDALAGQFSRILADAISAGPVPVARISQVGIGMPAIIDSQSGRVVFLATFDPEPCDFAMFVERQIGVPVKIDNHNNMLARAEHWFGGNAGVDDCTMVNIGLGVGAARYQSGQLLVGSHSIEAELGHTKIVPEGGRLCHCGARGCLETYSSISGIVGQYCERIGRVDSSYELILDSQMFAIFDDLAAQARRGDADAAALFRRAGRYLGIAIANHINMQDPDRIVVLANNPDLAALISEPFFEALHENTLPALRNLARVSFKALDEHNYARGAAAMVLEQLYLSPK